MLRRGRSTVIESGHTLILGWSPRIHTVVSELCVANENQRRPAIVILAGEDKQAMEDELAARISDTKRTRIVCRTGDPPNLDDLRMASAEAARSIIVLGAGEVAGDADAAVVKAVLAVLHVVEDATVPIVAEIDDAETSWALREASNRRLLTVRSSEVIARITAQACRQAGLSAVCQELLDFDGDEIYFQQVDALTGHTFGEALLAFEASSVIGLRRDDGTIAVNPPMDAVVEADDEVIAISEDDDTVVFSGFRDEARPDAAPRGPTAERRPSSCSSSGGTRSGRRCSASSTSSQSAGSTVDVIVDPDLVGPDELGDLGVDRLGVRFEAERGDLDELTQTVSAARSTT